MSPAASVTASQPLILHLGPILQRMSDHEFFACCQVNPEWRLERTKEGDLSRDAPNWRVDGNAPFHPHWAVQSVGGSGRDRPWF